MFKSNPHLKILMVLKFGKNVKDVSKTVKIGQSVQN